MTISRAWLLIGIAGLFEVIWAMSLKYSQGFTKPTASVVTLGAMAISMWLLAQGLRVLPAGTGYAVWTGIGAVGTALSASSLTNRAPPQVDLHWPMWLGYWTTGFE